MKIEELDDRLRAVEYQVGILWSTLEALRDAGDNENRVLETYQYAIYGVADKAFSIKQDLAQIIEDIAADRKSESILVICQELLKKILIWFLEKRVTLIDLW